jgi:alanyl-tRNA synthetase
LAKQKENWTSERIREAFLAYFEGKGHRRLPSASLVPVDDPSLLLINAGMAPLKRYFEGREAPPAPRCCSCQKCIRTIDIDQVGHTNRHNTFFEMLGNFSFGDYFKKDAIDYCWDFLTSAEWMAIPPERLYSTVHESDDEAWGHWELVWKTAGFEPRARIFRLGDRHNFWAAGDTGPCGYDSEVYFDLAPGEPFEGTREDFERWEDRGRFIEVWNNVFMEFSRDEAGNKTPLPKKNVDTGMGFERLVMVKQSLERGENWQTVFVSDLFDYIIKEILTEFELGFGFDEFVRRVNKYDFAGEFHRSIAIADYLRSSVFLLADGVTPTNEGRGYVLRRLIRRAIQFGFTLRANPKKRGEAFLAKLAEKVISNMSQVYPEVKHNSDKIKKYLAHEEGQFLRLLLDSYPGLLAEIEKAKAAGEALSGAVAFLYHDSYGLPFEVTRDACAQYGIALDEAEYERLMKEQKERARAATTFYSFSDDTKISIVLPDVEFLGYETLQVADAKAVAVRELSERVDTSIKWIVATNKTPFYAEGGGQPGDTGFIEGEGVRLRVIDSKQKGQHICELITGDPASLEGKTVTLTVDAARREAIARAHTATHLLHRALRDTLGAHVQQAGSQLYPDSFRFDFSHTEAMTPDEIARVEELVNGWIAGSHPVTTKTMPLADAKALGVTALFDEKYGQEVRVVSVGTPDGAQDYPHYPWRRDAVVSRELCGGTHVARSSDIGCFAVLREESVSAGMRRITAATGGEAWKALAEQAGFARRMRAAYNAPFAEIEARVKETETELRLTREKLIVSEREKIIGKWLDKAAGAAQEITRPDGSTIGAVMMQVDGVGKASLKFLADRIADAYPGKLVLLGENDGGKAAFVCKVPPELVKAGLKAGDIVRVAAQACGGGGGGRPDFAEAGAKDGEKVGEGIEAAKGAISSEGRN